jgi:hypothetical protein
MVSFLDGGYIAGQEGRGWTYVKLISNCIGASVRFLETAARSGDARASKTA